MRGDGKNQFYKYLDLDYETRKLITEYNRIKDKMLRDPEGGSNCL